MAASLLAAVAFSTRFIFTNPEIMNFLIIDFKESQQGRWSLGFWLLQQIGVHKVLIYLVLH